MNAQLFAEYVSTVVTPYVEELRSPEELAGGEAILQFLTTNASEEFLNCLTVDTWQQFELKLLQFLHNLTERWPIFRTNRPASADQIPHVWQHP
jgi:glycogen synthase